ncbi:MAG: esterase/lipase family protein [Novosphingobium sp.]
MTARRDDSRAQNPQRVEPIRKPLLGWTMLEPLRVLFETGMLVATCPALATAPRGDGHPVMVLPGFATSDAMTVALRQYLAMMGYQVFPWELGWNLDQHSVGENGEHIARRIEQIAEATGRAVSLVGWSLGGVLAREAARRDHAGLRQVITLSSPFTGDPRATSVSGIYEMLTGNQVTSDATRDRYAESHRPLPVPTSAIYSKSDGIAAWRNCLGEVGPLSENIEVHASHFGMVASPAVFWATADRLAQPEGDWRPFVPSGPYAAFFP